MAIYKTAYDTTACSGARVLDLQDKLARSNLMGGLEYKRIKLNDHDEPVTLLMLQGGNSSADVVPYFNHPIEIKTSESRTHGSTYDYAIDVRNFGKWYAPNQRFVVRNRPEFEWAIKRTLLNHIWLNSRPELLRDISALPASVYSSLISECIARRFVLDAAEQATIAVLACYFYYGLFTNDTEFDEFQKNKIVGSISRITRIPAEKVFSIVDDLPVLFSLEELCVACREKTGSVSLTDFNVGVLIAVVAGNWFGTNARENLAVGLEHIPTWIMIVDASLTEATYKRSVLAKISARYDKNNAGESMHKSLNLLLGGANMVEENFINQE